MSRNIWLTTYGTRVHMNNELTPTERIEAIPELVGRLVKDMERVYAGGGVSLDSIRIIVKAGGEDPSIAMEIGIYTEEKGAEDGTAGTEPEL